MKYFMFMCILWCEMVGVAQTISEQALYQKINDANDLVNTNTDQASILIQEALESSIDIGDSRAKGYCYNTLGAINFKLKSFKISITHYQKSIDIFNEVKDDNGAYNSLKYLSKSYEADNQLEAAKKNYLTFLSLANQRRLDKDVLEANEGLGRIFYLSDKQDIALDYFNESLLLSERLKDEKSIAENKYWIGLVNEKMGNEQVAVSNFNQSQKIALDNNNFETANQASNSLGDYYNKSSRNFEAIAVQKQAYIENTLRGNRRGELNNVQNIAKYELEENNPKDALPYIHTFIDISKELGDIEALTDANLLLSEAYEQQGQYDSAVTEYKKYLNLVDSLTNERAKEELLALKVGKDLNARVRELESLRKELDATHETFTSQITDLERTRAEEQQQRVIDQERSEYIMWSLGGLLLVVLLASLLIYKSARDKKRANQLLALKSLRSQMNPHFIFNSLNSVNSFIAMNDERSANKYLSEFSRLMRAVMENSKHDLVPLTSELDILKMYLSLEHLRFKNKFEFSFDVDATLNPDNINIPPMLIQPYVENAIWHGLRYKENKGSLSVSLKKVNQLIVVCIEDNGIGRLRSQELKTKNQKQNTSTGMKNIEGRLNILNQIHKTNLDVVVTDLIEDGIAQGTMVQITIPFNINKEAA